MTGTRERERESECAFVTRTLEEFPTCPRIKGTTVFRTGEIERAFITRTHEEFPKCPRIKKTIWDWD